MEYTNQYVFEGAAYPNRHRLRARPSTAESTSQTASKTVACTDHRGYPFHRSLDGRADAATGRGYFTVGPFSTASQCPRDTLNANGILHLQLLPRLVPRLQPCVAKNMVSALGAWGQWLGAGPEMRGAGLRHQPEDSTNE